MDQLSLNWATEKNAWLDFLTSTETTLGLVASDGSHPGKFLDWVLGMARVDYRVVVLDPRNLHHSTPPEALREVVTGLTDIGFIRKRRGWRPRMSSLEILSRIRAGGNVTLQNVTIQPTSGSAGDDLDRSKESIRGALKRGVKLDRFIVIFNRCHEMTQEMRESFHHTLWTNIFAEMAQSGAKFVFQYDDTTLAPSESCLPPHSRNKIELPSRLSDSALPELATHLRSLNLNQSIDEARGAARTLLITSPSVAETYERIALLELSSDRLAATA